MCRQGHKQSSARGRKEAETDTEMGMGTRGAMHIGSISFINNIMGSVTTKTANRQAPSGPVSPDSGISQRNLAHRHECAHTLLHTHGRANIHCTRFDTHERTHGRSSQVNASEIVLGRQIAAVSECVFAFVCVYTTAVKQFIQEQKFMGTVTVYLVA